MSDIMCASEYILDTHSATVTRLHNQTQVRRESTSIASASSFFIWVRSRHIISKLSWTLKHLSIIIRSILIFNFFCHCASFIGGVGDGNEITPGDTVKRVTCCTDFAVDLVASSNAGIEYRKNMTGQLECVAGRISYLAWSNVSKKPL